MTIVVILKKSHTVHLKPEGEICNRLQAGTKVRIIKKKVIGHLLIGEVKKKWDGYYYYL